MVRAAHRASNDRTTLDDPFDAPSVPIVDVARMAGRAEQAAEFLKGLAHEDRLMVLCALSQGEMSVSELERTLDLEQAAASQHLARLRLGGLVARRNDGSAVYYRLKGTQVQTILRALFQAFCAQRADRRQPNGKARPTRTK